MKPKKIHRLEWTKKSFHVLVFYKVYKGRKVYSCYVLGLDIDIEKREIRLPWFHGKFVKNCQIIENKT